MTDEQVKTLGGYISPRWSETEKMWAWGLGLTGAFLFALAWLWRLLRRRGVRNLLADVILVAWLVGLPAYFLIVHYLSH